MRRRFDTRLGPVKRAIGNVLYALLLIVGALALLAFVVGLFGVPGPNDWELP